VVSYASRHRWRALGESTVSFPNPEALVRAREVVVEEVQTHRVSVELDLLAKTIGEACEASHTHSHGQVLTLDVGR
jgi:hypothetical protein